MKIKLLPIFIVLMLLNSGCTMLSKNRYLAASGDHVKRNRDSGGYADFTFVRMGKGNNGIVNIDDVSAEIWSADYYSKELSYGLIIPIIPRFIPIFLPRFENYPDPYQSERWIRIKNTTEEKEITIKRIGNQLHNSTSVVFGRERHKPSVGYDETFEAEMNQGISLTIKAQEQIWMRVPECESIEITIQIGDKTTTIILKESTCLSWWMLV